MAQTMVRMTPLVKQEQDIVSIDDITVKITELSGNNMFFILLKSTARRAAQLQQIIMDKVPTMAIECICITKNTSVMDSEKLAHRLGLITLYSQTVDEYEEAQQNCQELCLSGGQVGRKGVGFSLYVQAVPNVITQITEKELVPFDENNPVRPVNMVVNWSNQEIEVSTPIANLRTGQEINLTAYATRGIGDQHAKYSPVSNSYFIRETTYDDGTIDFMFEIESKGGLPPIDIVKKALALLYKDIITPVAMKPEEKKKAEMIRTLIGM